MISERFASTILPGHATVFMGYSGLILKMISLSETHNSSGTVVSIYRKGEKHVLCNLTPNIREQVEVELHFSADDLPLTKFEVSGSNRVLLTGYTDGSGSIFGVKRKRSVQFALPRKRYEADYIDEDDDVLGEYEEDDDDDADTDTEDDNEDEEDDEGDEDVNDEDDEVKVNDDDDDDDEDDEDYVPPDEEDSLFASRFRFCDPFDRRFMSGIELRHFGLQSHENAEDEINLRDDEMDAIEKETNDRIALALINGLANSGEAPHVSEAPELLEKLKQTAPGIDKKIVRYEDTDPNMFRKKRKAINNTPSEPAKKHMKTSRKSFLKMRGKVDNGWTVL